MQNMITDGSGLNLQIVVARLIWVQKRGTGSPSDTDSAAVAAPTSGQGLLGL